MPGITGQGTTFNLPNYVGELFLATPSDTPLLSMIGGITGGVATDASLFQWQGVDLRDADANRQRVEGAAAPVAEARVRANVNNVCEIHQESIEISYTKQGSIGGFNSTGSDHPGTVGLNGANPVLDEFSRQTEWAIKQIARDVEASFTNGKFANPGDNTTPRKTRSIREASVSNRVDGGSLVGAGATMAVNGIVTAAGHGLSAGDPVVVRAATNGAATTLTEDQVYYAVNTTANTFQVSASPGGAVINLTAAGAAGGGDFYATSELTEDNVVGLLQRVWENGGISESETATVLVGGTLKRKLSNIFITDKNFQEVSRNVGGVNLQTFETDFGRLNIALSRYMPSGSVQVISAEQCRPRFLSIPGKGFLFVEAMAKTGATDKAQIYGEIGLEYGNEKTHGRIDGVNG